MSATVQLLTGLEEASRFAADYTAKLARQAVQDRGVFYLAVSGGATPRRYFEMLAAQSGAGAIAWDKCHIFWADERFVPHDDALSNYLLAKQAWLARIAIPAANIHPVPTNEPDPQAAAEAYETLLRQVMGAGGDFPRFDLVHLGLGSDGHTASLFPGDPALLEKTRWTASVPMAGLKPKVPRITLTLPALNAAERALFLISGEYKIALAERILSGRETASLPAAMVAPKGGTVWVVAQ